MKVSIRLSFVLFFLYVALQVGVEPTTYRLTADRSTTELLEIYNQYDS